MVTNTSKTPKIVILHCDFALSPDFHQVQNRQKSKFRPETLAEVENDLHTTWKCQTQHIIHYVPGKKWSQRPQNCQKSSFYTVILHYRLLSTKLGTGKNQVLDMKTLAEIEKTSTLLGKCQTQHIIHICSW